MVLSNSVPDASIFHESPSLSDHQEENTVEVDKGFCSRCEKHNLYYDMSGTKILIIFNHYKYKKTRHFKFLPSTRNGTYQDVKSLENTFRRRGFIVVTHHDFTYADIMSYLSDVCKKEHSHTSCIAIAIMTHGRGSHVCASDRLYPVADITDLLQAAPGLVGKPKLFFIQACRGGHTNPRASGEVTTIPVDSDCLVLYSSYEDYLSYRSTNGSWLMQALCSVVNSNHGSMDLASMVTLVNQMVAAKYASWGDKQMPVTELNLTKFLRL